jgi:transposase
MPAAITVQTDLSAHELRRLAAATKNANQSRRLLSIAAVLDGMNRTARPASAAWTGRPCATGCTASTSTVRTGSRTPGLKAIRPAAQQAELAQLVETGPDRAVHGVVRWRRVDLKGLIAERFGVDYHERTVGKILHQLGFAHISARPRHPAQDEQTVAEFKKTLRPR